MPEAHSTAGTPEEQRLTPREDEHLDEFPVQVACGAFTFAGRLIDESVTGVAVQLSEGAEVAVDSHVVVSSGQNARDAIVQRTWLDDDGCTRLGLLWRAAQFR